MVLCGSHMFELSVSKGVKEKNVTMIKGEI